MSQSRVECAYRDHDDTFRENSLDDLDGPLTAEPPHPINWNLLRADDAEAEWIELNRWVNWLRRTYGLPASVLPPFWHRHPELVWELSALHLHWLGAYDPDQLGSAPLGWHRDFADARQHLRDWVAVSRTRLERDRPTRQTAGQVNCLPTRWKTSSSVIVTRALCSSLPARCRR